MNAITTTDDRPNHDEVIRVLQNSLYPGAKRESIELVLAYCRANGLDPMLRPVYIVPTSVKNPDGAWETRDVLMPGIADYRIKAARSGEYGGKSEPEFGPDVRETLSGVAVAYPAWCRITVRRIVQGQPREFTATERWLENYATAKRDTQAPNAMWKKRPYGQLAKVAEAQALRMAFPEFSAGYTMEEMQGRTGQDDDWAGTTIEGSREPVRTARDALNDAIPLKAAAARTPPPERKVGAAEYEAPPPKPVDRSQWTDGMWRSWIDAKLRPECDKLTTREEVAALGEKASVKDAIDPKLAPEWVRRDVAEILADYFRSLPEASPSDDLDEVVIAGEEHLAAG